MTKGYITPRQFGRFDTTDVQASNLETMLESVSLASDTVDARVFASGDEVNIAPTKEQVISAAIQYAAATGKSRVYLAKSLEGYNAALVTFNANVQLVTETQLMGPASNLGSNTINAANYISTTKELGIQAAINAAVAQGKTAVFVPANMLPYDASQVTFNNTVRMYREGQARLDVFDIVAYGASQGLGGADNWAAIQACADQCNNRPAGTVVGASGGTIWHPEGRNYILKPVQIRGIGTNYVGCGQGFASDHAASTLVPNYAFGPALVMDSTTSVGGLVAGTGGFAAGWHFTDDTKWINFRDSRQCDLNGLSALCVEVFYNPDDQGSQRRLIHSAGKSAGSETLKEAFQIQGDNGTAYARITTTGSGTVQVTSGAGALTTGTLWYICLDWDGTTLRLFIGQPGQTTSMFTTGATGTLVQDVVEEVILGPLFDKNEVNTLATGPRGTIYSPRVSLVSRHTANFTVPNADLGSDSNTAGYTNFATTSGTCIQGTNKDGNGWYWQRYNAATGPGGFLIDGIDIGGNAVNTACASGVVISQNCINWRIRNGYFSSVRTGVFTPWVNAYEWRIGDMVLEGGLTGRSAINIVAGLGEIDNVDTIGFQIPISVQQGGVPMTNVFITCESGTVYGLVTNQLGANGSVAVCNGVSISTEPGVGSGFRSTIFLAGIGQPGSGISFHGGALESGNGLNGGVHIIADTTTVIKFQETDFIVTANETSIMKFRGYSFNYSIPAVFDNCHQQGTWIPWSDTAGTATVRPIGKGTAIAFASTLNLDCSLRDSFELNAFTGAVTINLINATPGQRISISTIQDGPGGRVLTFGNVNTTGIFKGASANDQTGNHYSKYLFEIELNLNAVQIGFSSGA